MYIKVFAFSNVNLLPYYNKLKSANQTQSSGNFSGASEDSAWATAAPAPQPKESVQQLGEVSSKKRAAPPPPEPTARLAPLPVRTDEQLNEAKDADKELYIQASTSSHSSKGASDFVSPGREALNILDDLNTALDKQNCSSLASISDDISAQEPSAIAPSLAHATEVIVHSPVPQHKIKDVVGAARAAAKSPSPVIQEHAHKSSSATSSSENVYRQDSLHKAESQQCVQDKAVIKVGMDVPYVPLSSMVEPRRSECGSPKPRQSSEKDTSKSPRVSQYKPSSPSSSPVSERVASTSSQASDQRNQLLQAPVATKPLNRAGSFRGLSSSQPGTTSSSSFSQYSPHGIQKSKTEPPLHYALLSSGKESPRNVKDYNYFEQFPAGPSTDSEYFVAPPSPEKKVPPPEPPVDYNDQQHSKENAPPVSTLNGAPFPSVSQDVAKTQDAVKQRPVKDSDVGVGIRKHPHRQTVTKKTRTYTIDGMQVTSTTMHVLGAKEDMQMRKQQLQDLRRLQREEARQKQKLQLEGANLVEQQERKFQQEKAVLTKQYEIDMEAMERKQKREIEEAEKLQEEEMKQAQKRLKYEQEKDLRAFKDRLKQEMKIMKQEMDMLPRQQRKDALRLKKDQMEHENHMKAFAFPSLFENFSFEWFESW
ncbi:hypothetical protein Y032_0692g1578 [Ancylostoma ceylanicum]|uniref:Uncharacterized protein n=2 Tax=Ancylostoma ceylanicum TaxID=53326 RepID=A0A016WGQ2_9BILA|nr:hypothetical protein Y032_0692g1578 [Ancylostoma ceylanicum]